MDEIEQTTALVTIKPEAKAEVLPVYAQALKLLEYAERRFITKYDDIKPATDDLAIISNVKHTLEDKRKEYVQPLQAQVKTINDAFKVLMEPIEQADKITRDKILTFNKEQDRIRQEQEEVNRLRYEAAQKDAALHGGEISESVDLIAVSAQSAKRIQTEMGTATQRDNWKWKLVDQSLVPEEYKVVDGTMLTAIAKKHHNSKPIPGIEFYNEPIIAVNART